jgi:hypothetical protein
LANRFQAKGNGFFGAHAGSLKFEIELVERIYDDDDLAANMGNAIHAEMSAIAKGSRTAIGIDSNDLGIVGQAGQHFFQVTDGHGLASEVGCWLLAF